MKWVLAYRQRLGGYRVKAGFKMMREKKNNNRKQQKKKMMRERTVVVLHMLFNIKYSTFNDKGAGIEMDMAQTDIWGQIKK